VIRNQDKVDGTKKTAEVKGRGSDRSSHSTGKVMPI